MQRATSSCTGNDAADDPSLECFPSPSGMEQGHRSEVVSSSAAGTARAAWAEAAPSSRERRASRAWSRVLGLLEIIEACRDQGGRPMSERLADELMAAFKKEGKAMATRDNTHRMADANKAFAHFAW